MGKKLSFVQKHAHRKSGSQSKHRMSVNKYAHLVPKRKGFYSSQDKTFRDLPLLGDPGEVIKAGLRTSFHGRVYTLIEDTAIPKISVATEPVPGKHLGIGKFRLVAQVD